MVSFVETMRGTLRDAAGQEQPVEFTVEAIEERPGHSRLAGVVSAPPWVQEAECSGLLTTAPGLRAIHYEVHFIADDGRALWLEATKHPRPWAPLRTMTEMPVVLRDAAGRPLSQGMMFFPNHTFGAFVASALPFVDGGRKALAARRRAAHRKALDAGKPSLAADNDVPRPEAAWRETLAALAATALPAGKVLPASSPAVLERLEDLLATFPPSVLSGYKTMLGALELSALPRWGKRFSQLEGEARTRALEDFDRPEATHVGLRLLLMPLKLAYLDDPAIHKALGLRFSVEPPATIEKNRWRDQISDAGTLADGEVLECDVVVVGTGAGGAPIARALAAKGHAVMMVEEGPHYTRRDFNGRAFEMMRRLYRDGGTTHTMGNTYIPLPVGKGVGGTTLVNSGTCLRAPDDTLRKWVFETGIGELGPDQLAPYFAQVEALLDVAPSSDAALGAAKRLIGRGASALGYAHGPLPRNAPGCDGQGLCCFGCPTDAKRGTNLSVVPGALERGAALFTGLAIDKILMRGDTAVGVSGTADGPSGKVRVTVNARVVVLACGTLHSPALLLKNNLANGSGEVGKNLSIHPALGVIALFDEVVKGWQTVPQGYAIHEFQDEGIMMEGVHATLDMTATLLQEWGDEWIDLVERAQHWLGFGFMVKDTSRGRVTLGRDGRPRARYVVNDHDTKRLLYGLGTLCRVFVAAGAAEIRTPLPHAKVVRSLRDIEALERHPAKARHFDLSAYHPLGTCRMGSDPLRSVVGGTHETHDVHNLFVCDGSAVPGPIGANPMMTIMAMSLRAAEMVHRRLERLAGQAA